MTSRSPTCELVAAALASAALLLSLGPSAVAAAQEPSAAEVAAARRLFRQGMRAGQEERWEEALDAFSRAYEVVPRPRILLNLASAEMHTGRLVEASNSYRRFLGEATGGAEAQYRQGVEEELAGLETRIPRVRIEVAGLERGDEVLVDGHGISRALLAVPLPFNPGDHEVVIVRGGERVASDAFSLEEEEELALDLDATPALPGAALSDQGPDVFGGQEDDGDDAESTGLLSSPWFWTGVGAVVAGAVVVTLLVLTGGGPERRFGNFGDGRLPIE